MWHVCICTTYPTYLHIHARLSLQTDTTKKEGRFSQVLQQERGCSQSSPRMRMINVRNYIKYPSIWLYEISCIYMFIEGYHVCLQHTILICPCVFLQPLSCCPPLACYLPNDVHVCMTLGLPTYLPTYHSYQQAGSRQEAGEHSEQSKEAGKIISWWGRLTYTQCMVL